MRVLPPDHGVRVLLELVHGGPEGAVYHVELHAPRTAWASRASIGAQGELAFTAFERLEGDPGEPEVWMIETARAFLRTVRKNHASEGDWPSRLLRWRERRD